MSETTTSKTSYNRDAAGRFGVGNVGGPGGTPGKKRGRGRALEVLDTMLEREEVLEELHAALLEEFHRDPVKFFVRLVVPLLPRDSKLEVASTGPVEIRWTGLVDQLDEADSRSPQD